MRTPEEIYKEVLKVQRERAVIKVSQVSDTMKKHLLAQVDEKMRALEAELAPPKK